MKRSRNEKGRSHKYRHVREEVFLQGASSSKQLTSRILCRGARVCLRYSIWGHPLWNSAKCRVERRSKHVQAILGIQESKDSTSLLSPAALMSSSSNRSGNGRQKCLVANV
eukprot:761576-Hanusia_phi.AAC.1